MSDLDAIRAQRLAQLRGQQGAASAPGFQLPAGMKPQGAPGQGEEDAAAKAQAQAQEEEMRRTLMGQILESDARERCEWSCHAVLWMSCSCSDEFSVAYSIDEAIACKADRGALGPYGQVGATEGQSRRQRTERTA